MDEGTKKVLIGGGIGLALAWLLSKRPAAPPAAIPALPPGNRLDQTRAEYAFIGSLVDHGALSPVVASAASELLNNPDVRVEVVHDWVLRMASAEPPPPEPEAAVILVPVESQEIPPPPPANICECETSADCIPRYGPGSWCKDRCWCQPPIRSSEGAAPAGDAMSSALDNNDSRHDMTADVIVSL